MKLSLCAWSLPSCTLHEATAIASAIGLDAVEVSSFYRSGLEKLAILEDPGSVCERLEKLDLPVSNYYHVFGDGTSSFDLANADSLSSNILELEKVLKFADQAHISTVLLLPGTILPGQNREEAAAASIRSLREMQSLASGFKATLCIEPHVQSYADSPGMALRIAEETGVSLTVDYAHFVCLGYRQNEIDPLLRHAGHMHLRQARPGVLQCKFAEGVVNFPALFGALRSAGYQGYLAIEYLHQANFNTLFDDVLTETIAVRDCMLRWMQDGPTK